MAYPKKAQFETLRTIAFGAIGVGFTAVGAAFTGPVRVINITNLTNQNLIFSDDGVNDKVIIPAGSGKVFDITTNRTNQENLLLPEGRFAHIRHTGVAPTNGACYFETIIGA
jgi:hypothetical protein